MGQDDEDREDERAVIAGQSSSDDYAAEIRHASRYERALAVKALIPLALVGLVSEVYRIVHG